MGAALIGAAALALAGAPMAQAAASPNVPVPQGIVATDVPGAAVFGDTPAATPETVSFVLKIKNESQAEQQVERGVGSIISVAQFAKEYGQDDATVRGLTSYLARFGITTTPNPDHIDVVASGTAGDFDAALSVTQKQFKAPGGHSSHGVKARGPQTFHGPTTAPTLPSSIASSVLTVLGLTNYAPWTSDISTAAQLANTSPSAKSLQAPPPAPANGADCTATIGLPEACNTPATYAQHYNLSPLYNRTNGRGETVGIVMFAQLDQGAPEQFWTDTLGLPNTGRTVTVQNIDGGPGTANIAPDGFDPSSIETDLDVEQAGGVAPGANIIVYQAADSDSGIADAYFAAAAQNVAISVNSSFGESEAALQASVAAGQETPEYEAANDEAFLEMALQGQSPFASSGDSGAYGDVGFDTATTAPVVEYPGASPFVTSAGGTTFPFQATFGSSLGLSLPVDVTAERAWGWDYLWPVEAAENGITVAQAAPQLVSGDGGGFSHEEAQPSYQHGVKGTTTFNQVEYLTPIDPEEVAPGLTLPTSWTVNPTPPVTTGRSPQVRQVPDISAGGGDPETGYLLFSPASPDNGIPEFDSIGGTSVNSPQFAGTAAVIDSFLGHRTGLWNPALYASASSQNSALTPLNTAGTTNDNLLYTGTPGTVYNPATGLGLPNFAKLAPQLGR